MNKPVVKTKSMMLPKRTVIPQSFAKRVEKNADKRFQPSRLHKAAFKFMIPIRFENGLTVGECKRYYDFIEAQSSFSRLIRSIRRPTVEPLAKKVDGKLPSCLRRGIRPRNVEPPRLRRSISFSNLPSDNSLMTEVLQSFAMMDMPVAPKVGFHDYVLVTHIASHEDYPAEVHQSIWMSKDELSVSMRQAMIAEKRERREREIFALQEDSLSDFSYFLLQMTAWKMKVPWTLRTWQFGQKFQTRTIYVTPLAKLRLFSKSIDLFSCQMAQRQEAG